MKSFLPLCSLVLCSLLLAGCAGGPDDGPRRGGPPGGRRGGEMSDPVYLEGQATYFDGLLKAELTMSNRLLKSLAEDRGGGGVPRDREGHSKASGSMTIGAGVGGGMGGGPGGGMGMEGPGGMGGGPGGGPGPDREHGPGERLAMGPRESRLPPVSIRLVLTNLSDKPLKVRVWELKSELGNFAVRPDELTLEPGGRASPNLMTSYLGLSSGQVPATLDLRLNGREEKQVIVLSPAKPQAGPKAP